MTNEEHLEILKQGVEVWNRWREENPGIRPDLSGADLGRANLSGAYLGLAKLVETDLSFADLNEANLCGAVLSQAILIHAHLIGADLHGANLSEANLGWADLHEADLREAILREAHLSEAHLSGAHLHDAILSEAHLIGADLIGADLRDTDLREADLSRADLREADLSEANLSRADLREADLREANLRGTDFHRADLREANLGWADLSLAKLVGANLSEANLREASLVETNLAKADLTGCSIYGISAWNLNLAGATQSNLIISRYDEPTITVDNLEVAQFIYLLLNHKKLRDVLNAVTERGVLILGRFGDGGLELLQAIAAKLRELNYLPIIFEFDKPESRNFTETIKTLVGLSRFVIADLSGPSVPQELYATVPHFKIPFVPIIEKGRKPYSMFVDISEYPWVVRPVEFEDKAQLLKLLPEKIIDPAEEKHQERQKLLDELFRADEG